MRTHYTENFRFGNTQDVNKNEKTKLMDKVTKLFALADSTNHPEEAENAKRLAVELLAKHNIRIDEVKAKQEKHVIVTEFKKSRQFNYERFLYDALAEFTGVYFLYNTSTNFFRYVGTVSNIEAFKYILNVVLEQRERDWENHHSLFHTKKNAWMMGFTIGVAEKCEELKQSTSIEIQERGLVPVDEMEIAANWFKKKHKVVSTKIEQPLADQAGIDAGHNVNLNKGVTDNQTEILQIG